MLYYNFKNYDEFKELFGIVEHGNGVKSRRNKIMLSLWKDRSFLKMHIRTIAYKSDRVLRDHAISRYERICDNNHKKNRDLWYSIKWHYMHMVDYPKCEHECEHYFDLLGCSDMVSLRNMLFDALTGANDFQGGSNHLSLNGRGYRSNLYETDDMNGLCEDGTINAIRYRNIERDRVFKMKAGKMFNHILSVNNLTNRLPEQIQRWLSEEFVAEWIQYATDNLTDSQFELHVDDDFRKIYSSHCCKGNFGSCMVDDDQYHFYEDSVEAKAAYLTNCDGWVVARCIIFTDVEDEDGNKWRLAERQYSSDSRPELQRQLVTALIREGYIDGYKSIGASCSDARDFVSNDGNPLRDKEFRIDCNLDVDGTLSYQDSFKWYNLDDNVAYNFSGCCFTHRLDTTESSLEDNHDHDNWSNYNNGYINEDDSYYVESRDDYFYYDQVVNAMMWNSHNLRYFEESCFEDDCIEINGTYYYAGHEQESPNCYNLYECPVCGNYFVGGEDYYSDVTDESYCCESCQNRAEKDWHEENCDVFSEYDNEWYAKDEVVIAYRWSHKWTLLGGWHYAYVKYPISIDSLDFLIEDEQATYVNGVAYIDDIGLDGEPIHFCAAELRAA